MSDYKHLPSIAGTIARMHSIVGLKRGNDMAFVEFAVKNMSGINWERNPKGWKLIVQGMAMMAPNNHDPKQPLGKVLAELKYSELRLKRLLEAPDEIRFELVMRVILFLKSKGKAVNWIDIARLLLTKDASKRDNLNIEIAKAFYLQPGN